MSKKTINTSGLGRFSILRRRWRADFDARTARRPMVFGFAVAQAMRQELVEGRLGGERSGLFAG
ncbi:hypothetical protein [Herbaspirillum sp. YR522]|uniref:hypothetical protein n=1 Tax=Herbaspirillum sp. YR522 TaxID=1144342 RepID=UPI00026F9A02|nr:hypothetical protein [Herbaspirillum sp. YR522]EJN02957.1 hypothetical protein PMI40_02910 [Herbaspirillum sp. YR522]